MRARLCEGRGRTFKSCQVHQFERKENHADIYAMQTQTWAHGTDRVDSFRVRKEESVLADQKRRRMARDRCWRHDARELCGWARTRPSRSVRKHRVACLTITEWPRWRG